MRANEFLSELWTQPYALTSRAIGPASWEYYFDTKDNRSGRIVFDSLLDTDQGGLHVVLVIVHFYIDNLYHTSGKGDAIAIFSTVVSACRDYLRRYRPPVVVFETDDEKKRNLYVKMSRMFPDYVAYPNWRKDPVVGDAILDSLTDGVPEDAVVLHRRDYVPEKTRVYVESKLNELTDNDYYGGNDDDSILPWAEILAALEQWAEDSNALNFEERDGGRTAMTTWGPELGAPYAQYVMFVSPYGDGEMYGMLLGLYEDGEFDEIQTFKVPASMNGVNYAARVYMQVRM